jgi:hypothetical protein
MSAPQDRQERNREEAAQEQMLYVEEGSERPSLARRSVRAPEARLRARNGGSRDDAFLGLVTASKTTGPGLRGQEARGTVGDHELEVNR